MRFSHSDDAVRDERSLQYVSPLPPLATGIAQYSRDFLNAVDGAWRLRVVPEAGSRVPAWETIQAGTGRLRRPGPSASSIFQLGNSGNHAIAFQRALHESGVVVLHDVVLHHGRLLSLLRHRGGRRYRTLMRDRYGVAGDRFAEALVSGQPVDGFADFPLFEDYVERARVTVVHSEYARSRVLERVPSADVLRVPMGIPLPALVDQAVARQALGLPATAFVVASVTHVNPYKRIPVVLRALRRVVDQIPELVLVVAGSAAPGIDVARLAAMYGVQRNVRVLGYVIDDEARLVARAADICVNLRYPSAGETSASLLRLLGAGRPVIVTDDDSMAEYPRDAVLPVPVDRLEEEMVAEAILLLYQHDSLRQDSGTAARAFVEREHSMAAEIAGYQVAIERAFGVSMPPVETATMYEAPPRTVVMTTQGSYSTLDGAVAQALVGLGLYNKADTIHRVGRAMTDLRFEKLPVERSERTWTMVTDEPIIQQELLDILACPVCKANVRLEDETLICEGCQRRYAIENGIPIMLPEDVK